MSRICDVPDAHTQLLLQAQRGNVRAFAELYAALSPPVKDYLTSLNSRLCPHERDDLTQEVFLRTWQALATYRGEALAKTFVFAIARNTFLKYLSRQKRSLPVVHVDSLGHLPGQNPPWESEDSPRDAMYKLAQAMAMLTEAQRQAVELHLIRGLPRTEAVRLAHCNHNQFANRLYRALIILRRFMNDLPKSAS